MHPADCLHTVGLYGKKHLFRSQIEMGMGFECAGEIVDVGPGVDVSNIGKKVAFGDNPH